MRSVFFLSVVLFLFTITGISQNTSTYLYADTVTWGSHYTRTQYRDSASPQGRANGKGAMSGFYETTNPVNFPAGANSWWHLLDVRHSNFDNNFAMQFSGSFFDQNLFFRKTINNPTTSWSRVVLEDPNGTAAVGRLLTRSIAYNDGDKFNYNNGNQSYAINNYGLEWNSDSWASGYGPTANLSGFGGMKFFTGSNHRMCITVGGNVGIGTTAPTSPLTVAANVADGVGILKVSGTEPDVIFDDTDGGYNTFTFLNSGSPKWAFGRDIDNNFYFTRNEAGSWIDNTMVIKGGSGKVGIGTNNPTELLSVNGTIASRRVRVTQAGWPDYVFEPSYSLRPLDSLETFIRTHKHLPEVISAVEEEKKGIDLGENQAILLKKVEELTLYIIQLKREFNAKLEGQDQKIEMQRNQIQLLQLQAK